MNRRIILQSAAAIATGAALTAVDGKAEPAGPPRRRHGANIIEARDGTQLFYRDWGQGRPILFVAAWGLHSQAWQYQMTSLADAGFRCVAFDRRSHGRSSDPGAGYDLDTLADDVASVIDGLDLRDAVLVGHSLGAAEAVRYLSRHGQARVRRLALIAPTTPFLLKTEDNPDGLDAGIFEAMRAAFRQDFPGVLAANIKPFVVPATSQAMIDWIVQMMTDTPVKALIDCNATFTVADFRRELPLLKLPVQVIQGDADASAPLALTGRKTASSIPGARLTVYEGAPHGLIFTHADRISADLRAFAAADGGG